MKIVASTRLSKAQKPWLHLVFSMKLIKNSCLMLNQNQLKKLLKSDDKTLLIVVSSDKGLCGSIHSQVSKAARKRTEELNGNVDIVYW